MPYCADCSSWLSKRYAERQNAHQNDDGDVICAVCAGVYDDDDRPVAKPDGGFVHHSHSTSIEGDTPTNNGNSVSEAEQPVALERIAVDERAVIDPRVTGLLVVVLGLVLIGMIATGAVL